MDGVGPDGKERKRREGVGGTAHDRLLVLRVTDELIRKFYKKKG